MFGVIVIVVNCKILSMSSGVNLLNLIIIIISVGLYWLSQFLVGKVLNAPEEIVMLN